MNLKKEKKMIYVDFRSLVIILYCKMTSVSRNKLGVPRQCVNLNRSSIRTTTHTSRSDVWAALVEYGQGTA